jgi:mono/diheme cytochrome c family protein
MYAAATERSIAIVLLAVVVVGWAIYVFVNIRQSKRELGSEIELAANRGSLPDDEELEGPRLEKVQAFGVLMLLIIALVLPIYWLREGGRRSGAETGFAERAADRGEQRAVELGCTNCHGADLNGANFAPVNLDIGNQFSDVDSFVVNTTWRGPALNTVFQRFDTGASSLAEVDEVRNILVYGRGVMPAWGLEGGGPLNDQAIDDLVAWLWRERLSDEEATARALEAKEAAMAAEPDKSEGQVLFELHCARCHTPRWPGRGPATLPNNGGEIEVLPGPPGAGRYGPALNSVGLAQLFQDPEDQVAFIAAGAADNVAYGDQNTRLGNYGMPGFGKILTEEEIRAIVDYERSLDPDQQSTVDFAELHTESEAPEDAE